MYFDVSIWDHNFLVNIESCCLRIISGNWGIFEKSFTNHLHSYYELHYVTGGQGELITDSFEMPLSKGCFYLLPPKTYHEQLSNSADFLKEYHLSFEIVSHSEDNLVWMHLLKDGLYHPDQSQIEVFFDNIAKELKDKQYGYLDIVRQSIQSVFIQLMRSGARRVNFAPTQSIPIDDKRVMQIDDAFLYQYETLTLSSLSNQLSLSSRQTQRFIKDRYGVSFSTLKYRAKLSHAAMLLTTTNLTANEICLQIGYKNYACFSRMFKKYYKVSPLSYRKSATHKKV